MIGVSPWNELFLHFIGVSSSRLKLTIIKLQAKTLHSTKIPTYDKLRSTEDVTWQLGLQISGGEESLLRSYLVLKHIW